MLGDFIPTMQFYGLQKISYVQNATKKCYRTICFSPWFLEVRKRKRRVNANIECLVWAEDVLLCLFALSLPSPPPRLDRTHTTPLSIFSRAPTPTTSNPSHSTQPNQKLSPTQSGFLPAQAKNSMSHVHIGSSSFSNISLFAAFLNCLN